MQISNKISIESNDKPYAIALNPNTSRALARKLENDPPPEFLSTTQKLFYELIKPAKMLWEIEILEVRWLLDGECLKIETLTEYIAVKKAADSYRIELGMGFIDWCNFCYRYP